MFESEFPTRTTSTVATSDAHAKISNAGVIIAAIIATAADDALAVPIRRPPTGQRKNSQSAGLVSIGPRLGPGRTADNTHGIVLSTLRQINAGMAYWGACLASNQEV